MLNRRYGVPDVPWSQGSRLTVLPLHLSVATGAASEGLVEETVKVVKTEERLREVVV